MADVISHLNPLQYKAVGVLDFEAESSINIGLGDTGVRKAFLRIPEYDKFLIPSSTWKGAFRSISERLAKNMPFKHKLAETAVKFYREKEMGISYQGKPEDLEDFKKFTDTVIKVLRGDKTELPYASSEISEMAERIGYEKREIHEIERMGLQTRGGLAYRLAEDLLAVHCPIGRLYGNRLLAGKVRFLDSILERRAVKVEIRPGAGIDRKSGKVREGSLYFTETLTRGTRIKLIVIADNLISKEGDSRLFASTLNTIAEIGISIGTRKSAGLGMLKLNVESSYWYLIELGEDKKGLGLSNPFKYGKRKSFSEFKKWLWS
jgi:CRISPR/Cas system CSM-associated protein Csm3 (group 7 of RAMP superfamily)